MRNMLGGLALEATLAAIRARLDAVVQTNVTDRADRLLGLAAVTNFPAVQAADVVDRVARVLGVADISDRAARVLGRVTVDNFPTSTTVTGNVEVTNDVGNPLPVSGPLTDAQLRAARVLVTTQHNQPVTNTELRAAPVPTDMSDRWGRALGSLHIVDADTTSRRARVDESGALLVSAASRRTAVATAPAVLTVGVTSSVIVPANPNRLSLIIQNPTNSDIYLGYGAAPTLANGLRVPKSGGQLVETNFTGAIHGLSTAVVACPYVEVSVG